MSIKNKLKNFFSMEDEYEYIEEQIPESPSNEKQHPSNVVNLTAMQQATAKMVLYEPKSFHDVQEIADHIVNRRSVVVNLQRLEQSQKWRLIDFLSGTIYAVNGNMQKLGAETFLCTPDNVDVSGTISDLPTQEKENKRW